MAANKFRWTSFPGTRSQGSICAHGTLTLATKRNQQHIHLQMSDTKTPCFLFKKSYRVLFEPIFKSRLKGWDQSRKLNCDSSLTINPNTCHKTKTSWNMHITEMFYILRMMISQKAIIFVSKNSYLQLQWSSCLFSFKPCISRCHR